MVAGSQCLKRAVRETSREVAMSTDETGSANDAPTSGEGAGANRAENEDEDAAKLCHL